MKWYIADIKSKKDDGYVTEVIAICKHVDGIGRSSAVHVLEFEGEPGDDFIDFENLTEIEVLQWVKDDLGEDQVAAIENQVTTEAELRKNIADQLDYSIEKPW